jgi:hypothetical protein
MTKAEKAGLRVVGGNDKLAAIKRAANDPMWHRLRLVRPDDVIPELYDPVVERRPVDQQSGVMMWIVGLALATLQGISQAIAPYW